MTRPSPFATNTTRVMIVDDHPIVRQGYTMLLATQADLNICGEAESEADALRLAREENPDLAIVDISLANGSGIDLIKNLTARSPSCASWPRQLMMNRCSPSVPCAWRHGLYQQDGGCRSLDQCGPQDSQR